MKVLDTLALELQAVVGYPLWVLGTELGFSRVRLSHPSRSLTHWSCKCMRHSTVYAAP